MCSLSFVFCFFFFFSGNVAWFVFFTIKYTKSNEDEMLFLHKTKSKRY